MTVLDLLTLLQNLADRGHGNDRVMFSPSDGILLFNIARVSTEDQLVLICEEAL